MFSEVQANDIVGRLAGCPPLPPSAAAPAESSLRAHSSSQRLPLCGASNESLSSDQTLYDSCSCSLIQFDGSSGSALTISTDALFTQPQLPLLPPRVEAYSTSKSAPLPRLHTSSGPLPPAPGLPPSAPGASRAAPSTRGGAPHRNTRPTGYRRMWAAVCAPKAAADGSSGGAGAAPGAWRDVSVEELIRDVQALPAAAPVVDAVRAGLAYVDSRAFAALLKGLAKAGLAHRATELFDEIRWGGVGWALGVALGASGRGSGREVWRREIRNMAAERSPLIFNP